MTSSKTTLKNGGIVPEFTEPGQIEAIATLHNAMGELMTAVMICKQQGIPLADAFTAIGMEIPTFLQPMVNQLAERIPDMDIVPSAT